MNAQAELLEALYATIDLVQSSHYAAARRFLEDRRWMREPWARDLSPRVRDDLEDLYGEVIDALVGRVPDHRRAADGCERIRAYLHRMERSRAESAA